MSHAKLRNYPLPISDDEEEEEEGRENMRMLTWDKMQCRPTNRPNAVSDSLFLRANCRAGGKRTSHLIHVNKGDYHAFR